MHDRSSALQFGELRNVHERYVPVGEDHQEELSDPLVPLAEPESAKSKSKSQRSRRLRFIAVSVLGVSALGFVSFYFGTHFKQSNDAQKMQGTVALSERGLRNLVKAEHLTVYWTGPVAGDRYTLFIPKKGAAVVRYMPAGANITDAAPIYRLVATYVLKDAFAMTVASASEAANLGFVNIDGHAVSYVRTRSTNVFVGLKGKDIQLEIFDPGPGQALALALFKGQIQQLK